MDKIKCTLIIATYNWPEALRICLQAVTQQSILPAEVIIADDGSTQATADIINEIKTHAPFNLKHVWHEDFGFRKTIILNKAIAKASGSYIIQVDGDVVPHKHFIKDHLEFAEAGVYVAGTRVNTNEALKNRIIMQQLINVPLLASGSKNFFNSLRLPFLTRLLQNYRTAEKEIYYVKGCNMAFWKKDFIAVNGYDESFTGWGLEDSDLAIRLHKNGVRKKYLKMAAIVYHLWHKAFERDREEINLILMRKAAAGDAIKATKGIGQYLAQ
jgi:GT2 family glycosyltransferase